MTGRLLPWLLVLALLSQLAQAAKPDADVDRLEAELAQLDGDPSLVGAAGLERLRAREAVETLRKTRGKDRPSVLRIAELRVETARLVAQTVPLVEQSRSLDSDRDAILIEASRQDALKARRETELMRQQALAREEEAERGELASQQQRAKAVAEVEAANEEAAQARKLAEARALEAELARQEAELAAQVLQEPEPAAAPLIEQQSRSGKIVHILAGKAFASGKATLTPAAREALGKLAAVIKPGKRKIQIEGYTDSQGNDAGNQALSLQRAQAVRTTLLRWGIASSRLVAIGKGEKSPLASNASEAGRARNRRVEISQD